MTSHQRIRRRAIWTGFGSMAFLFIIVTIVGPTLA